MRRRQLEDAIGAAHYALDDFIPRPPHWVVGADGDEGGAVLRIHFLDPVPERTLAFAECTLRNVLPMWMFVRATCR